MSLCSCNDDVKNFGQPNCVGILERPQKLIFTHRVANDGTVNKISSSDTIDDTFVSGKVNETDQSKKWFFSPVINKVNDTRAENNTFEIDGFKINTSKGVRTFAFTVVDGACPEMADAFESMACRDMAFWTASITDQIGGNGRVANELNPFRMKKKTMRVLYQPPNKENETPAMVMVAFDISELEKDGDIAFIDNGTGDNDVQVVISDYTGLVDVEMKAATNITTTTFRVPIDLIYGAQFDKEEFVGGVIGDFTLVEIDPTPGSITITSVTEVAATDTTPHYYAFVIPTATSADVLRLTFAKTGFQALGTIDITIP